MKSYKVHQEMPRGPISEYLLCFQQNMLNHIWRREKIALDEKVVQLLGENNLLCSETLERTAYI